MVRANPLDLFRKERDYLIIVEGILNTHEGLSYRNLNIKLKDYNIKHLREKLRLLISDHIIDIIRGYPNILYIEERKRELFKQYINLNKEMIKTLNNENVKSSIIDREKDRKKIY